MFPGDKTAARGPSAAPPPQPQPPPQPNTDQKNISFSAWRLSAVTASSTTLLMFIAMYQRPVATDFFFLSFFKIRFEQFLGS